MRGALVFLCVLLVGCGVSFYDREAFHIHKRLAYLYLREGRYAEALREASLAEKINSKDPEVYNLKGLIFMAQNEMIKAETNFKKAIWMNPKYSEALNNLGALYLVKGKYDAAIKYFEMALSNPFYSKPFTALTNMGWAWYKKGDAKKAKEYLLKALNYNPRYSKAYYYLGIIALEEGNLEEAKFYLKRAARFDPNDMESRYMLGEVLFQMGETEKARKVWKSIVELAPDSPWALKAEVRLYDLSEKKGAK